MLPALSIIVVGFNSRAVLAPCLAALENARDPALPEEILLVDNASGDGTTDWVRQAHPRVQVLANGTNAGFARACNQALALARGRLILFLNPDTELPPGAARALIDALEADPRAALISPRLNGDGPPAPGADPTLRRLMLAKLGFPFREPVAGPVDWVLGACMLGRADILRSLGGFDEDYFLYGEDLDLCDRARAAGWHVLYCPSVTVFHRGNDVWDSVRLARVRGALLTFYRKRRRRVWYLLLQLGLRAVTMLERFTRARVGDRSGGDASDTPSARERKADLG